MMNWRNSPCAYRQPKFYSMLRPDETSPTLHLEIIDVPRAGQQETQE
jgi:hypothetical protein